MERDVLLMVPVMRTRRKQSRRGFTLVELGAVVAIIGILSVLAMVSYRKYMLHSKITEAKAVIGAIKIAQEDYRAEKGSYLANGTAWCPGNAAAGGGVHKVGWDPACMGGLAVHVNGPVLFRYRTTAGNGAFADDFGVSGWVTGTANVRPPYYQIQAQCDLDGNTADRTDLFSSSASGEIFSHDDGK